MDSVRLSREPIRLSLSFVFQGTRLRYRFRSSPTAPELSNAMVDGSEALMDGTSTNTTLADTSLSSVALKLSVFGVLIAVRFKSAVKDNELDPKRRASSVAL